MMKTERIILASASPRRKELLGMMGVPFTVVKSDAPEVITESAPGMIVQQLSRQKAEAVAGKMTDGVVIGADTIVWAQERPLGKPAGREEAFAMLRLLQGKAHSVFTGVTLLRVQGGRTVQADSFFSETVVHVHGMSDQEINTYLDSGDSFDKAGAYGIQGPFAAFVDGIEGDYYNVVGLPVPAVYQHLKNFIAD